MSLADLGDEAFICLPTSSGLRRILDQATTAAGSSARVPFEVATLARIRDLASHGLGVAVLARSVALGPGPPVAVHSLAPEPLYRPIGLIHRQDRPLTPAAAACRDLLAQWPARSQ